MTDRRRAPHPANTLNELPGEEWLYFTKSLLTTAYPSELGHAARRAHGANKPPRLMARLIEFFSRSGELVLDPFAGVGGTLLGAAIARGPRRAIGIELDPRWAAVFEQVVRDLANERDGAGPDLADLGATDPGGPRPFDPSGVELRVGDALALLPTIAGGSIDFVATDPPYNLQLPMTMAGGALAETHANRRTDYAMVTDSADDLANAADYPTFLDRMERVFGELERVLRPGGYAVVIVRDAYQDGRYVFTGSDLAARAAAVGLVPKGDLIWYQAGTRLRPYGYPRAFVPNIVHQHILVLRREAGASGLAPATRLEVGLEDVAVDVGLAHRPAVRDDRHGGDRPFGRPVLAVDDLAEGHLVEPALLPVRAQDEPVGAVLLEQLDLVTLIEIADLGSAQLVGRVEQPDDAIADGPPLAPIERADEALVEGQARRRRGVADRIVLACLEERRPPPARHQSLHLGDRGG